MMTTVTGKSFFGLRRKHVCSCKVTSWGYVTFRGHTPVPPTTTTSPTASGIRGLVAMTIHLQFSHLVIPECNKTVWPPCLAPTLLTITRNAPSFIKQSVNFKIQTPCPFYLFYSWVATKQLLAEGRVGNYTGEGVTCVIMRRRMSTKARHQQGQRSLRSGQPVFTLAKELQLWAETVCQALDIISQLALLDFSKAN